MLDKLSKYVGWVLYVLLAVSAVLAILFYTNTPSNTEVFMQWGYILIIACVVIAIISPIYGFILAPKNAIKLLIILGVVAVIALLSYSIAGNTISQTRLDILNIDAHTSRMVGMGLYFTYFAGGAAILAIIFSSFIKLFK